MEKTVLLPKMGLTMVGATIVEWKKAEGDAITQGEPLYTMETGKATVDVEAPYTGILKEILVPEDEEAECGDPVAIIEVAE